MVAASFWSGAARAHGGCQIENGYGLAPLALFDLGLEAGPLAEAPFGANMAFPKAVFAKYGGFRVDLGPGSGTHCGEDSDFVQRLLTAGERLWYKPLAIVYHPVPSNRLRKQYFLNWWFNKGRSEVRALGLPSNVKLVVAGIPLRLFRRLAVWTVRWTLAVRPVHRFCNKLEVWSLAGHILECHRQAYSVQDKREHVRSN